MKRLLSVLGLAALLWIVAVLMGAQLLQTLRDAAQPTGLPYGLTMVQHVLAGQVIDPVEVENFAWMGD